MKISNIKKYIIFSIFGLTILFGLNLNSAHGQNNESFFYGEEYQGNLLGEEEKTDLAKIIKDDSINTKDSNLLYKIRQYFRLTGGIYDEDEAPATAYISMIINMALGLTSLISLVLIVFAFYLMFFQKGEEGFAKAKKILIGVAIALVIMALSWLIVSFFFEIYTEQASQNI